MSTPHSSLWLVPPETSPLHQSLHHLIHTSIPSLYPTAAPPAFPPHITLTADTVSSPSTSAQQRLDDLDLSHLENFTVAIGEVDVGEIFFRKLTMKCVKDAGICGLAGYFRGTGEARDWVRETYRPHVSLMYSDLPEDEVRAKLEEVKTVVRQAREGGAERAKGAEIWLVPTFKDVDEWVPTARRKLSGVEWSWKT